MLSCLSYVLFLYVLTNEIGEDDSGPCRLSALLVHPYFKYILIRYANGEKQQKIQNLAVESRY
jgi:hypothetical protein